MALKIAKTFYSFRRSIKKYLRLIAGQEYFTKKVNGVTLLLDTRNLVDRHVDVSGSYEEKQIKKLVSLISKYQCTKFIDIGAHWGLYSLFLRNTQALQGLDVIAFEPDKINMYQFNANLFLNRIEDITIHNLGLSNSTGSASFSRAKSYNRGANKITAEGDVEIKIARGDDILKFKNEKLALKIDVEGHEKETIDGMSNLLINNLCLLQIESFDGAEREMASLLGTGYRYLESIDNDHYFTNFPI